MKHEELDYFDATNVLRRLPDKVVKALVIHATNVFIGGGFIRACIANEPANDVDLFVREPIFAGDLATILSGEERFSNKELIDHVRRKADILDLEELTNFVSSESIPYWLKIDRLQVNRISPHRNIWWSPNAFTVKGLGLPVQIIHRWTFQTPVDAIDSFDFTIAQAAIWNDGSKELGKGWRSVCHPRFYQDVAGKRLVYCHPVRIEEAGGSTLRVLKFYQRGYRIPLRSFAGVIARLTMAVKNMDGMDENGRTKVLAGLLREVDPNTPETHAAYIQEDHPMFNEKDSNEAPQQT